MKPCFRYVDAAKTACYFRLHPQPWVDTTVGARRLYDSVCVLWRDALTERANSSVNVGLDTVTAV